MVTLIFIFLLWKINFIVFGGMLFELWELENVPVTFKESLWHTLVDHATVYADERIVFRFKDGTEITTML